MLVFSMAMSVGGASTVEAATKAKYRCEACSKEFKTLIMAKLHLLKIDANGMHTFKTIK